MSILPFAAGSIYARQNGARLSDMRAGLDDLQRQLTTGQKSATYGGLGIDRRISLDTHARLAAIGGYNASIADGQLRAKFMTQAVEQMAKASASAQSDISAAGYHPSADGRTPGQVQIEDRMKQALQLLNTEVDGRYLFAGRASDTRPAESFDAIINGSGTANGVAQLVKERKAADRGVNGLGRLDTPSIVGTNVVHLAQAAGAGPFGFKIAGMTSSGSAITPASAAGSPIDLTVAGQPANGDKLRITLNLPDGTTTAIELTARTDGQATDDNSFAVGSTPADTAIALRNALQAALGKSADSTLAAASAIKASTDFFLNPGSVPRVVGGTPETASAYDGSSGKQTISWYKGDDATPALDPSLTDAQKLAATTAAIRATGTVKVADNQSVAMGVQANESGFARMLAQYAAATVESFDAAKPTDQARYAALGERINANLSDTSKQRVQDIGVQLSVANATLTTVKEQHVTATNLLKNTLADAEQVDKNDVAVALLDLQTRLQASYQTTSSLSKLSLVNYL